MIKTLLSLTIIYGSIMGFWIYWGLTHAYSGVL